MSKVFINDLAALLDGEGSLSLTLGTNLFRKQAPDGLAGTIVSLHNTGGLEPEVTHDSKMTDKVDALVMIRHEDEDEHDAAMTLAMQIYEFLATVANQAIGGTNYLRIKPKSPPHPFARTEEDQGWKISFNVRALRAPN